MKSRLLSVFNLAQQTAEIGSWEWAMLTGKVWWSDELYKIFEVEADKYIPDRGVIAKSAFEINLMGLK